MKLLLWILAGAAAGWMGEVPGLLAGALLGGLVGSLQLRQDRIDQQEKRLSALETEIVALRRQLRQGMAQPQSALAPPPLPPQPANAPAPAAAEETLHFDLDLPVATNEATPIAPVPVPPATTRPAPAGADSSFDLDALHERFRAWLFGGNLMVRAGLLVLFFGLAFLARYATENFQLSPALRLGGIAGVGLVLAAVGWRLRERRRGYALSLQGGGIAVLYLVSFAALRLYGLLEAGQALALMVALVAVSAWLALRQDAPVLAIIGSAGGFAAPILTSTGAGNHVQLFGYYALLNAGILLLAWRRAWRGLNLTGALFTFGIGLAWGFHYYQPAHFGSVEPFLLLFWLMYLAAALAYSWRHAPRVDTLLLFAVPAVAFGLQAALVHDMRYGLAWSAAAAGALYLLLAASLHRLGRSELGPLRDALFALGIAFATLAIPLAVSGHWSAAAWALEGAALWWVGLRQRRWLASAAGLLLQLGAGLMFAETLSHGSELRALPLLNSAWLGSSLIAAAGLLSAWFAHRETQRCPPAVALGLLGWALLWWLAGGWAEIDAHLYTGLRPAAQLLFFAATAATATWAACRLDWRGLRLAGLLPLAGMVLNLLQAWSYGVPPSEHLGWLAWPLALTAHYHALRGLERGPLPMPLLGHLHGAGLVLVAVALARDLGLRLQAPELGEAWALAALALPAALLLGLLIHLSRGQRWPMPQWRAAYLISAGAPLAAGLALWSLTLQLLSAGDPAPLPYLPLLNPLELALAAALGAIALWLRTLRRQDLAAATVLDRLRWLLAALAFVVANGVLLRAMHQLGGLPWEPLALLADSRSQTGLSLFWALLGLSLMLLANRRASRLPWLAGAGLMAAVVAKLFLVDMAASGTLERIVAFIGAGVVLLVVGYFSPLPPREGEKAGGKAADGTPPA